MISDSSKARRNSIFFPNERAGVLVQGLHACISNDTILFLCRQNRASLFFPDRMNLSEAISGNTDETPPPWDELTIAHFIKASIASFLKSKRHSCRT